MNKILLYFQNKARFGAENTHKQVHLYNEET